MFAAVVIIVTIASCAVVIQASDKKPDSTHRQQIAQAVEETSPVQKEEIKTEPKPTAPDFVPRPKGYHILVKKSDRLMSIYVSGRLYRAYSIELGFTPDGHKIRRGDGRTPEGEYYVCKRNPNSAYYLSLLVSYPSPRDAKSGVENGLVGASTLNDVVRAYNNRSTPPQDTRLGGNICIHGEGSRPRNSDWTAGCIAVTNKEMAEIFSLIPIGTPVTIQL